MVARGSPLAERLESLSDRSGGPAGCWEWTGTIHHTGYGLLQYDGETRGAHVWALIVATGRDPRDDGLQALHSCDNRRCVNPAHLRAGTHQENMDDKVARNRQSHARPHSILTEDAAYVIRAAWDSGAADVDALALTFGVKPATVKAVGMRERWKRLPEIHDGAVVSTPTTTE